MAGLCGSLTKLNTKQMGLLKGHLGIMLDTLSKPLHFFPSLPGANKPAVLELAELNDHQIDHQFVTKQNFSSFGEYKAA